MKKSFLFLLLPVVAFMPPAKPVRIKGHMQTPDPVKMVYLSFRTVDGSVNDSSVLENGTFKFTKQIEEPTLAFLTVKFEKDNGKSKTRFERMQLFLEPGEINVTIKDSLKFATVTGSRAHAAFQQLTQKQQPFTEAGRELSRTYMEYKKGNNEAAMKQVEQQMESLNQRKEEEVLRPFVVKNPKSPIALYALQEYAGYELDASKIAPLFAKLPAGVQRSPSGKAFKEQIEIARKTGVGVYAMDFTQNDTLGNPVSLSSFKGKYVLLDFWASWCGPCRAENPNVVKVFNKYKDKNFTVLGVSLDRAGAKDKWLEAIHKDGLTWNHVSDLKFWDNEVAKQYGIRAIPQNLLIDPQGKIIAKNIRGEALEKRMGEVLGTN